MREIEKKTVNSIRGLGSGGGCRTTDPPTVTLTRLFFFFLSIFQFLHQKLTELHSSPQVLPRLTPCSSSFISCSVTFGVLSASLRQWAFSSGTRYSSTSLRGRPRARPCLEVEGTASSRMEPLRVLSCQQKKKKRNYILTVNLNYIKKMKSI